MNTTGLHLVLRMFMDIISQRIYQKTISDNADKIYQYIYEYICIEKMLPMIYLLQFSVGLGGIMFFTGLEKDEKQLKNGVGIKKLIVIAMIWKC